VDTGGLTDDASIPMDVEIQKQVMQAIAEADLMLLVVDAKTGLHPQDQRVVELLRDSHKPWLLVANKVDDPRSTDFYEFYNLGAGDPIPVSAINGKNTGDQLDEVVSRFPESTVEDDDSLRVAVIGRPNVGKSSLVNRLLGEDRLVVAAEAGTTRDAIDTPMQYPGQTLTFVDTAGLRRQSKIDEGIEFYSSLRTRRAIERAQICVLMLDAGVGLENQDLKIATLAWDQGCGLIVVVNKWDIKEEKTDKSAAKFQKDAGEKAPFLKFVPFLFTSALTGQRVSKVLEHVLQVDAERKKRISTAQVNTTLGELTARLQPPQAAGREVKLLYATQVEVEPPTIAVFGNHPDLVPEHYVRYLHNGFREAWGFSGSPLRILLRSRAA
jgi:GTP-binding protein